MIDKKEVLLRLACAALQGGMTPGDVYTELDTEYDLWYIAHQIYPESFPIDEEEEDEVKQPPKAKYDY